MRRRRGAWSCSTLQHPAVRKMARSSQRNQPRRNRNASLSPERSSRSGGGRTKLRRNREVTRMRVRLHTLLASACRGQKSTSAVRLIRGEDNKPATHPDDRRERRTAVAMTIGDAGESRFASLLFGGERAFMGGTKVSPLGGSKTIGESTRDRDRGFAQAENESLAGPLLRTRWRRDALLESGTSVPAARMALASGSGRWAERTGPEACCRTGGRSSITIAGAASVLAAGWIAGPCTPPVRDRRLPPVGTLLRREYGGGTL